jgi:hypothetical protein
MSYTKPSRKDELMRLRIMGIVEIPKSLFAMSFSVFDLSCPFEPHFSAAPSSSEVIRTKIAKSDTKGILHVSFPRVLLGMIPTTDKSISHSSDPLCRTSSAFKRGASRFQRKAASLPHLLFYHMDIANNSRQSMIAEAGAAYQIRYHLDCNVPKSAHHSRGAGKGQR